MPKPSLHPLWATLEENDPTTGLPNKVEPTAQWKNSGQKDGEFVPRAYLNYNFDLLSEWTTYLDGEVDNLNATVGDIGKVDVSLGTTPTLTRDQANSYIYMSGSSLTLANVVSVGGGVEQVGSTIKVRTTNITTVNLSVGATRVGFTGSIPADRIATFTIEDIPSGTGTQWSCEISAGV